MAYFEGQNVGFRECRYLQLLGSTLTFHHSVQADTSANKLSLQKAFVQDFHHHGPHPTIILPRNTFSGIGQEQFLNSKIHLWPQTFTGVSVRGTNLTGGMFAVFVKLVGLCIARTHAISMVTYDGNEESPCSKGATYSFMVHFLLPC